MVAGKVGRYIDQRDNLIRTYDVSEAEVVSFCFVAKTAKSLENVHNSLSIKVFRVGGWVSNSPKTAERPDHWAPEIIKAILFSSHQMNPRVRIKVNP